MAPFTNTEACSHPIFHLLAKKMSQFACPHASWGDNPDCNLTGTNGFPVTPFRASLAPPTE